MNNDKRPASKRAHLIDELATLMADVTEQELGPLVREIKTELAQLRERSQAILAELDELRERAARQRETVRQYFCEYRYGDGITMGIALTRMLKAAGLDPVWPEEIPRHDRDALRILAEHSALTEEVARLRAAEVTRASRESDETRLRDWLDSDDTGLSSIAMARHLAPRADLGVHVPCHPRDQKCYPRDRSDFDRCCRLLETVPALRPHLPTMAELSPTWARLVDAWGELEMLRRAAGANEIARQLDARIKALTAPAGGA